MRMRRSDTQPPREANVRSLWYERSRKLVPDWIDILGIEYWIPDISKGIGLDIMIAFVIPPQSHTEQA